MDALEELNSRLRVIRDRVRGVALGHQTGFYLFGRAGTSKTYTVRTTLDEIGTPYYYHTGSLTPVGLFQVLLEQHDRVIVLDDMAELFNQPKALQILLAALGRGGEGERVIRYRKHDGHAAVWFTGGIIAISNLELHGSARRDRAPSRARARSTPPRATGPRLRGQRISGTRIRESGGTASSRSSSPVRRVRNYGSPATTSAGSAAGVEEGGRRPADGREGDRR